jgi:hypothetical protein
VISKREGGGVNSELRKRFLNGTLLKSGTVCITLNIFIVANVIFYVRTTFYTDSVDIFNIRSHKIYRPSIYNK